MLYGIATRVMSKINIKKKKEYQERRNILVINSLPGHLDAEPLKLHLHHNSH